jgi:DNA-binding beta-propeller fold protein YncE
MRVLDANHCVDNQGLTLGTPSAGTIQTFHASDLESQKNASNVATSSRESSLARSVSLPSYAIRFLRFAIVHPADHTFILAGPGSGPGELLHPKGIAVDTSGNLVVVDSGNHRVQVGPYQCPTILKRPAKAACDNAQPHGLITRDQIFKQTGEVLRVFGKGPGKGPGEFDSPWGVAVDTSDGNLIISDTNNHRIQVPISSWDVLMSLADFSPRYLPRDQGCACARVNPDLLSSRHPSEDVWYLRFCKGPGK